MSLKQSLSLKGFSFLLKVAIILSLIIGIFARFSHLDSKLYSHDETFSTTNIFGHDLASKGIIDSRIVSVRELQSYQKVNGEKFAI